MPWAVYRWYWKLFSCSVAGENTRNGSFERKTGNGKKGRFERNLWENNHSSIPDTVRPIK